MSRKPNITGLTGSLDVYKLESMQIDAGKPNCDKHPDIACGVVPLSVES